MFLGKRSWLRAFDITSVPSSDVVATGRAVLDGLCAWRISVARDARSWPPAKRSHLASPAPSSPGLAWLHAHEAKNERGEPGHRASRRLASEHFDRHRRRRPIRRRAAGARTTTREGQLKGKLVRRPSSLVAAAHRRSDICGVGGAVEMLAGDGSSPRTTRAPSSRTGRAVTPPDSASAQGGSPKLSPATLAQLTRLRYAARLRPRTAMQPHARWRWP
jgi:hypothetical protein